MIRITLPKLPCKRTTKKVLKHGHIGLHTIYWLHGMGEAPGLMVGTLYGLLCVSTIAVAYVLDEVE